MRLAYQGMTRCQAQCPKDKSGSTDINILITEPTRTWIIKYDRSRKSKQFAPLPSCPQMNFCKVIHSINTGTGRLTTLLSFHSQRPPTEGQVGSDYPRTAKFPPITSLPYIRSHLWLGNSQKASFVRPQIFLFGQPQLVTLHVSAKPQEPHIIRVGAGADESCLSFTRKPEQMFQKLTSGSRQLQGSPENPSLSARTLSLGACFLGDQKPLSEPGWGRDAGQCLSWTGGQQKEESSSFGPQQR